MDGIIQWLTSIAHQLKLWTIVRPWEIAIRVRCGKRASLLPPGTHFRIPLFDEVLPFNTKIRLAPIPSQTLTTIDGKILTVGGVVAFHILNPLEAMLAMQQPEDSCASFAQASISDYVLARDLVGIDRDELRTCITSELEILMTGVTIDFVRLTDFVVVHRAFRLLGDEWRPQTKVDAHDKQE